MTPLAVFRLPLGAATLLIGVALWRVAPGSLGLAFGAVALVSQAPMAVARLRLDPTPGPLVHSQKNLLFDNATPQAILADIRAVDPDTVTLQEVSVPNRHAIFDVLARDYPSSAFCTSGGVAGVAVLSRWPSASEPVCSGGRGRGMVALRLAAPHGSFWVVSLQLYWPWPYGQPAQIARMLPGLRVLDGPVLVGGDFNMVPWSSVLRQFERASGARRR